MFDLNQQIQEWDKWIRQGSPDEVRADLKKISLKALKPPERIEVAKICRRVHLYQLATQVLFPMVRGGDGLKVSANAHEIAEYSASLICLGSANEARALLSNVDPMEAAEVLLYHAFADIMTWNFSSAVDFLNLYLQTTSLNDYQKRVAEVNLANSLVGSRRFEEAQALMRKIIQESKSLGQNLIYTTTLCHLGDLYIETNDIEAARTTLNLARTELPKSDFTHHLMLDEIRAKLGALTGALRVTSELFDQIKGKAIEFGAYETARDCDFAKAKWFNDEKAYQSAYVGTIFPAFRQKLAALAFSQPSVAYVSIVGLGETDVLSEPPLNYFDLEAPHDLTLGETTHRMLVALNQDFYRPLMMGEFFECLFPKTYYDPFTSPNRLRQAIRRTRAWLKEHSIPLTILADNHSLKIQNSAGFFTRIPSERSHLSKSILEQILLKAFKCFGQNQFEGHELVTKQICTDRQARRYLNQAVTNGQLIKKGKGIYSRYYFVHHP